MADKPQTIVLGQTNGIPDAIWEKICETKRKILEKNKNRAHVSHQEAIYKLILSNCQ